MTTKVRNLRELSKHKADRLDRRLETRNTVLKIACRIKKVYLPGDENPKGFEHLNDNIIRVEINILDRAFAGYKDSVSGWVFPLQQDVSLSGWIYGDDGLENKDCSLHFIFPNIKATGMVYVDMVNGLSHTKDKTENKDFLQAKCFNLTKVLV